MTSHPSIRPSSPSDCHTIGVLVMAYGGPDSLDDIEPYLLDVRGGRATSAEMVEEMRERYRLIGGHSPILECTLAQARRLQQTLNGSTDGPVYRCIVGMRHWTPRINTALSQMQREGISQAVGLVMAPHYSHMSIGAYFKKVDDADSQVEVAPIKRWHLLPELLDTLTARVTTALKAFPSDVRDRVSIIFTAHSLPERILEWNDPYPDELRSTVEGVVQQLRRAGVANPHEFAYQSASNTFDHWLGPDAGDVIERLQGNGIHGALVVPIGFTSDHVEILYDIDVELARRAKRLGFVIDRIPMLNDDPTIMFGIARLVRQTAAERGWL